MSGKRGRLILRPGAQDGVHDGAPGSARHLARHIRRMALLVRGAVEQEEVQALVRKDKGPRALVKLTGRELTGPELAGLDPSGVDPLGVDQPGPEALEIGPHGPEQAGAGQDEPEQGRGWWVLAQGGPLDESDFEAREAAREALLERVRRAGVLVGENVWVWDLSGRAQLVLTTLPTLERARKVAMRLRQKGLAIVVRREMP